MHTKFFFVLYQRALPCLVYQWTAYTDIYIYKVIIFINKSGHFVIYSYDKNAPCNFFFNRK